MISNAKVINWATTSGADVNVDTIRIVNGDNAHLAFGKRFVPMLKDLLAADGYTIGAIHDIIAGTGATVTVAL